MKRDVNPERERQSGWAVQPQRQAEPEPEMDEYDDDDDGGDDESLAWEYILLTGIAGETAGAFRTASPRCVWLTKEGPELISDFSDRDRNVSEPDAVLSAIADLGDQGWEMVGPPWNGLLFFKRPKA
ncbi:MAG TPA: hypothetical protein VFD32_11455 [Dehalococcoidia bacterium]|nr:hypothetical protein [Dehalococcoidia bacterium]